MKLFKKGLQNFNFEKWFVCLVLVLFLVSCTSDSPDVPDTPATPDVPVTSVVPVTPDVPVVPGTPVEPVVSENVLSELRCVDNKINAVISNNNGVPLELARDIKVIVNGLNVVDPICDSLIVQPGEAVFCDDLSGHYAIRPGQTNTVKLNFLRKSIIEVVECPE